MWEVLLIPNKVSIWAERKGLVNLISNDSEKFNSYIDFYRRLLLFDERKNLSSKLKNIQNLLSFGEKIFSSSSVAELFLYFCLHGAATAWVLQTELNMPEATVYRAMKRLRAMKIIIPALKVSKIRNSKGGPRPTIWALKGASKEEISRALRLHLRTSSPKYIIAEEVAQTILDEYLSTRNVNEITYREILIHVKELSLPFHRPDVADITAQYLHEKGVKVWR